MSDVMPTPVSPEAAEMRLREDLADGDVALHATRPILRHLLANRDTSLFSDEVIARVRGMICHVARELLFARAEAQGSDDPAAFASPQVASLAGRLLDDTGFLSHAHALVIEHLTAEQLQRRSGIDPVLTPLLQEMAASGEQEATGAAVAAIAAQARFAQQMRRMELPLQDLPADLFHKALVAMRDHAGNDDPAVRAETAMRGQYDESRTRLGKLAQLVTGLGRKAPRALSIDHAGLAIFASALGMASGQERNLVLLSFSETQQTRLVLALRAAGLGQSVLEEQFLYFHPEGQVPAEIERITVERATVLLDAADMQGLG